MTQTLKVGVVGVGGVLRLHMPGWAASPHAEVIAAADVNESVLKSWGKDHGVTKLFNRAEDLFADPEIDVVDLCVPNMLHAPLATAALNAGKHVLCEKPLAPTPKEIRQMIAARDRAGKMLMTAQHHRFRGISQAMKREIEDGMLGDIYHARSWMLRRNGLIPTPTFIHKHLSGGGPGIDIGVHVLDLTLWLMGNPTPVTVSGVAKAPLAHHEGSFATWRSGGTIPKDFDVEDFAAAFVRFDNDATLLIEVSWLLHHNTDKEDMQIWLYGTEAGCHWPSGSFYSTNYRTKQLYTTQLAHIEEKLAPHAQECVDFAQAIVEGTDCPVPAEQSLVVLGILDGIYRSQIAKREVVVDLGL